MLSKSFKVGRSTIGPGFPPIFLPDIDVYFNKNLDLAKKLIDRLVDSGSTFIKGAVIHNLDMVLNDDTQQGYMTAKGVKQERYRDILARKILSLKDYETIFKYALKQGCDLVISVYDCEGADFSKDIGACCVKIPSSGITNEPLIQYTCKMGLPIIIDTGKSTLEEIARAVQWAQDAGVEHLAIEHSPVAPPAPLSDHNLRMMQTLAQTFECPVGLSDHHSSEEMLYAAVALGASILEKGLIDDGQDNDIDVYHALPISKVKEVLEKSSNIFQALGSGMRYLPRDREKPKDRVGLIAKTTLTPGSAIDSTNTGFAFPSKGISAEFWSLIKGSHIRRILKKGEIIKWSDIEFLDT